MAEKTKTVEYKDEANDEFSGKVRNTVKVDAGFCYIHTGLLWRIAEIFVYRCVMLPFAWIYCKIKFRHRIVNKKALKECKGKGYFIFGNHTMFAGDAFIPNLINFPRKTYTIVHPDNISLPLVKNFLLMNGAIPIPTDFHASKNYLSAIEKRVVEHNAICIYPEAHIWPYHTKIRPMHIASFEYPVKFRDPVYCFTNTFSKRRFSKTPKVTTYIDGPFYPDGTLGVREQEKQLSDKIFAAMSERAKNNTYTPINYVKAEDKK